MGDPVTVFAIVNGAAGLVLKCGSVIKSLHDIAGKHKKAGTAVTSMVAEIDTIELAWSRIRKWAEEYSKDAAVDVDLLHRLDRSLECDTLVMSALQNDLSGYKENYSRLGFRQRSKAVWNEKALQDHQNRVRGQAGAISLLLQVLKLPTPEDRSKLLQESSLALQVSDESACSIIPSRRSSSTDSSNPRDSVEFADLRYLSLSFEEELFTAPVYKRRYGDPLIHSVFRNNLERTKLTDAPESGTERPEQGIVLTESSLQPQGTQQNRVPISKHYETFMQALKELSLSEKQMIQFGLLPVLWQLFPRRHDLEGDVGNSDELGWYYNSEIAEAKATLKDFCRAWSDTITLVHPEMSATLARAENRMKMPAIGLILGGMKQERLLDCFRTSQKPDSSLPLSLVALEGVLNADDAHHAVVFATEQFAVYTVAFYARIFYTRRGQTSPSVRNNLESEIAQFEKIRHRHIIPLVDTLFQPAVTTNLKSLLFDYAGDGWNKCSGFF